MNKNKVIVILGATLFLFVIFFLFFLQRTQSGFEWYRQSIIYDPTFALPGVDLDEMILSIDSLDLSRARIISLDYYDDEITNSLNDVLYPTEWLRSLVEVEQLRRTIINTKDELLVADYHNQILGALSLYKDYVQKYIEFYNTHTEQLQSNGQKSLFMSGQSSLGSFVRNAEYYMYQIQQLEEKANKRFTCYRELVGNCKSDFFEPLQKISPYAGSEVNEIVLSAIQQIRADQEPLDSQVADIVRLSTSDCSINFSGKYYYVSRHNGDLQNKIIKIHPLDDMALRNVGSDIYKKSDYYNENKAKGGGEYAFQSSVNYYTCVDVVYDLTRITGLLQVRDFVASHVFNSIPVTNRNLTTQVQELDVIAVKIKNQSYVDEYEINNYMRSMYEILQDYDEQILYEELGKQVVLDMQELILSYRLGTADFDQLVGLVSENNDAIISYGQFGQWDYLSELWGMRSVPALLLGGTNPSIVPEKISWTEERAVFTGRTYKFLVQDILGLESYDFVIEEVLKTQKADKIILEEALEKLQ